VVRGADGEFVLDGLALAIGAAAVTGLDVAEEAG
jgi:hypothetical protein